MISILLLLSLFWEPLDQVSTQERPIVVLVGIDGFRWDYMDRFETPHIDRVINDGFRVKRLIPCYPSHTFPNFITIVTGERPQVHGIVSNNMYDSETKLYYTGKDPVETNNHIWYQSPFIWERAQALGVKTAAFAFVGSELQGREPNHLVTFQEYAYLRKTNAYSQVAQLKSWLEMEQPPQLILLYEGVLDVVGHKDGPNSPELKKAMGQVDILIGKVAKVIKESKRPVNLIFVSDHGMIEFDKNHMPISEIREVLSPKDKPLIINSHANVNIFLQNTSSWHLKRVIAKLPKRPYLHWYTQANHPHKLHKTRNGHIIGEIDPPFVFSENLEKSADYRGGHGYHPEYIQMSATCFGMGPAFEANSKIDRLSNLEIFPLLLHLIGQQQNLKKWGPVMADAKQ